MAKAIALLASLAVSLPACTKEGPKNANFRFEMQFSESGIFDCWAAKDRVRLGVPPVLPYGTRKPEGMSNETLMQALTVEIETFPSTKTNHIDRLWGIASFTDDDKEITVPLSNGKNAHFERFGPTPSWPFKDKNDSQLFFTFRVDNGPIYKCKAVYQPDQ